MGKTHWSYWIISGTQSQSSNNNVFVLFISNLSLNKRNCFRSLFIYVYLLGQKSMTRLLTVDMHYAKPLYFSVFFFLLPDHFCLTHCTSCSASKEWFPSWKDCRHIHHGTRLGGEKGIKLNIWIYFLNVFTFISSLPCFLSLLLVIWELLDFIMLFLSMFFSKAFLLNHSALFFFINTHLAAQLLHSGISCVNCS